MTALPGLLLLNGSFHHNISIMAEHNLDEGLLANLDFIFNDLYALKFNDTYGRTSNFEREVSITADNRFICYTHYLAMAYANLSRPVLCVGILRRDGAACPRHKLLFPTQELHRQRDDCENHAAASCEFRALWRSKRCRYGAYSRL